MRLPILLLCLLLASPAFAGDESKTTPAGMKTPGPGGPLKVLTHVDAAVTPAEQLKRLVAAADAARDRRDWTAMGRLLELAIPRTSPQG
jgi:hypothetical protein